MAPAPVPQTRIARCASPRRTGAHVAWVTEDLLAYQGVDEDGAPVVRLVTRSAPHEVQAFEPTGDGVYTNPVGWFDRLLVVEQCCGRDVDDFDQPAVGHYYEPGA